MIEEAPLMNNVFFQPFTVHGMNGLLATARLHVELAQERTRGLSWLKHPTEELALGMRRRFCSVKINHAHVCILVL